MSKSMELEDYVHGLVETGETKIAAQDLSGLSLAELEAVLGLNITGDEETDKVAYGMLAEKCGPSDRHTTWLDQFAGTPLHAKAIQIAEQELALEQDELQRRIKREAEMKDDQNSWTQRDALRLQKDMLALELHKSNASSGGGGQDPTMVPQLAAPEAPETEVEVETAPAAPAPKAKPGREEKKTAGLFDKIAKKDDRPGILESGAMQTQLIREHKGIQGASGALAGGIAGGMIGHASQEGKHLREEALKSNVHNRANVSRVNRGLKDGNHFGPGRSYVSHGRIDRMLSAAGKGAPLGKKLIGAAKKHGPTAAGAALGATALGALGVASAGAERKARERLSKTSSDVQVTGGVNNGESGAPTMPTAMLGIEGAGRRATAAEEKAQSQVAADVQFREVGKGTKTSGLLAAVEGRRGGPF